MDSIFTGLLIILGSDWLYLCVVSMLCVTQDAYLETYQCIGQILLISALPYFGAVLALKFISQYSPELVAKYYIPPPFRGMIIESPLRSPITRKSIRRIWSGCFRRYSQKGFLFMKAKVVTSILSGALLPWTYFIFVRISSMDTYQNGVLVSSASKSSGIGLFIQHNGIAGSLITYSIAAIIIALITFCIFSFNNWLAEKSLQK